MNALEKLLDRVWFSRFSEKLRYLAVGGFNTAASYLIFLLMYYAFGRIYWLAIILQNFVSINISIATMRYFVFHSRGNLPREYRRAGGVYAFMLALNYAWMFAAEYVLTIAAPVAQGIFIVSSVILTYILHKYFSFRK
ncbi:MAG: GtrA family protein [Rickettsiales bacterium]|jgi:putative flippase GtrA|nr:GtrA family protein [Rickettsiales bacterium]